MASDLLGKITLPLRYIIGLVRTVLVLLVVVVYVVVVQGLCLVLVSLPCDHFLHILTSPDTSPTLTSRYLISLEIRPHSCRIAATRVLLDLS